MAKPTRSEGGIGAGGGGGGASPVSRQFGKTTRSPWIAPVSAGTEGAGGPEAARAAPPKLKAAPVSPAPPAASRMRRENRMSSLMISLWPHPR